jgi:hypothetical protein
MASPLFVKLGGAHNDSFMSYGLTVLVAVHVVAFGVWVVLALRSGAQRKPATKAD